MSRICTNKLNLGVEDHGKKKCGDREARTLDLLLMRQTL